VQKFGGTSVATGQRREMVAGKVIEAFKSGYKPVVVVSAIGRKGDPYSTDTLLSLVNNEECKIDKREIDLLMCCGEIISAVVLAETFEKKGYKTKVFTGGQAGIITNSNYGDADIIKIDKKYKVWVQGFIKNEQLNHLRKGVHLEDGLTAPAEVRLLQRDDHISIIELIIHEGRKRQVKRMCKTVGHSVKRLQRTALGFLDLEGLKPGEFRYLLQEEVNRLLALSAREDNTMVGGK
jgi:hypothetical protein